MQINGTSALVTGANRGIGLAFANALLEQGATKVYAGVRDPETITDPRLTPLRLDVTDPAQVAAAAETAPDVHIVINNAGVSASTGLLSGSFDEARRALEVNYFGTWAVTRAFAPVLARNGGGALVNMLSIASWIGMPNAPAYAASKSAQWSLTNAFRPTLTAQGTLVVGVHCGYVETDLSARVVASKISPDTVAEQTMQALLRDRDEVLADQVALDIRATLADELTATYAVPIV